MSEAESDLIAPGGVDARLAPDDTGARAIPLDLGSGLDAHVRRTLLQQERAIAHKYRSNDAQMRIYTVVTLTCFALWLSFFPLTMLGLVPLWIAFPVSCVFAAGGYIISHEAMHCNIGRPGTRAHFWNELVGEVATIILTIPFSLARSLHLEHHYHCNDPELDPDYSDAASGPVAAWYRTWLTRQPGKDGAIHHYKRVLEGLGTPIARRALQEALLLQLFSVGVFCVMALSGYALEAALVWWLPRHIGMSYIRYFLSWAPHHPRTGTSRYDNTRLFRSRLGHILSMGMQYHLIHHLHPHIPNHMTKYAYAEMKPLLIARGVDCSAV